MMNVARVALVLVLLGIGGYKVVGYLPNQPEQPQQVITQTFGLEKTLPQTLQNDSQTAQILAGVCDGLADRLEADGKLAAPRLNYTANVDDLRKLSLDIATDGQKISTKHPEFGSTLGKVFSQHLGDDAQASLTQEKRATAIALFRATAYAVRKVK